MEYTEEIRELQEAQKCRVVKETATSSEPKDLKRENIDEQIICYDYLKCNDNS